MFIHAFCTVYFSYTINIFSNTYTTSDHMTITAQNARARRALQPRGFSIKKMFLTLLRSFTENKIMHKSVLERINVPETVLGRLRSSAPHKRSIRKDDMKVSTSLTRQVFEGASYVNFCHCESRVSNTS